MFVATAKQTRGSVTLTFDDIPGGSIQSQFGGMPTYKGFNFSSTLDWIDLEGTNWPYGAHSGDFGMLNRVGGIGIVTDSGGADFTFEGLWAKKWGTSKDSGGVDSLFGSFSGYNNGVPIWSVDTSLNGSYEFYGPQVGAIDELRLNLGSFFLVDDISLNASTGNVPEPTSLMIWGLLGAVCLKRRRR